MEKEGERGELAGCEKEAERVRKRGGCGCLGWVGSGCVVILCESCVRCNIFCGWPIFRSFSEILSF